LVPVSCIPSPESPLKRIATDWISCTRFCGMEARAVPPCRK
jgi:hypothetical protein